MKHRSFKSELLRAIPAMALISGAVVWAEHLGWLNGLETAGLDTVVRFQAPIPHSEQIFIVEITDEDYANFFKSTSPLDADRLGQLLTEVLAAGPKVVGIDIDTSAPQMQLLRTKYHLDRDPRLVWASVPGKDGAPGPVMGAPVSATTHYGVPLFPQENDCAVRRYRRTYELAGRTEDALAWSIVKAIPGPPPSGGEEVILNLHGSTDQFPVIAASQFLQPPPGTHPSFAMLNGQKVLVGGSFSAARDEYATAVGRMPGVELMAHAVASDLSNGGVREFFLAGAIAVDFLIGFLVVSAFHYIASVRLAFWLTAIGTTALAFAASALAFGSAMYWINFVPLVLGMLLHQLLDHAERHRELQKENAELRKRLARD